MSLITSGIMPYVSHYIFYASYTSRRIDFSIPLTNRSVTRSVNAITQYNPTYRDIFNEKKTESKIYCDGNTLLI